MAEIEPTAPDTATPAPETKQEAALEAKKKVITHPKLRSSTVIDAAGEAVLTFDVPSSVEWYLEWIRMQSNSVLATRVELYDSIVARLHSFDFSANGNDEQGEYSKPPYFAGSSSLIVRWTGGTAGKKVWFAAQVRQEA